MATTSDREITGALLRLDTKVMGLVLGVVVGLTIFIMTNWLLLFRGGHVTETGEYVVGPHLQLLGQVFLGYRVSFVGSLIGLGYGFVAGTLAGSLIGMIYNFLTSFRK